MADETKINEVEEETFELMHSLPVTQQRFITMYLTGNYTQVKLAQLLGIHVNTLRSWLRRDDVKQVIETLQEENNKQIKVQLNALTNKAVATMCKMLESPIDGVALQAAKDILDRGGHKAKQEIKKEVTVTTYEQRLSNLINDTIDVDYVDIGDEVKE